MPKLRTVTLPPFKKNNDFEEVFVSVFFGFFRYNFNPLRLCFESVIYFLMIEGSGSESGYEPVTCGSGKPKNLRIQITVYVAHPKLFQRRAQTFLCCRLC